MSASSLDTQLIVGELEVNLLNQQVSRGGQRTPKNQWQYGELAALPGMVWV